MFGRVFLYLLCLCLQEITHFRANIKYSPKKLWYIAFMVCERTFTLNAVFVHIALCVASYTIKPGVQTHDFTRVDLYENWEQLVVRSTLITRSIMITEPIKKLVTL